jgi:CheY-like chemotaxis protein
MTTSQELLFLLADDDHDDAELFQEALSESRLPVQLFHVEDGLRVLEFLGNKHNGRPDLIFLDLNMPGMSGWQCLARLKNDIYFQDIPVIMYSTSSHPRDKQIAIELGAMGFVTKPSDFRILCRVLSEITSNLRGDLKSALQSIHK